jgi:hypothetical protein
VRLFFAHRPSPAMVVACIALLVALGGTSYAIQALPQNSVGTQQLKNNAVASKKIKNGAVNASKVKNGSLLRADFKAGQLPGATNVTVVTSTSTDAMPVATATCPPGRVATGGGGAVGADPPARPDVVPLRLLPGCGGFRRAAERVDGAGSGYRTPRRPSQARHGVRHLRSALTLVAPE